MAHRPSTYLSDDEFDRLKHIGERHDAGVSTMIHLAVKAFLGDPLPPWAERVLEELHDVAPA